MILAEDDLEHQVEDLGADLILEWCAVVVKIEVPEFEVLLVSDLLILAQALDLSCKVADDSSVVDSGTVIVCHLVADEDVIGDLDVIVW